MRIPDRVSGGVLVAVVLIGCGMAWARISRLQADLELQAAGLVQAEQQARTLEKSTGALRQAAREARIAAQTWSNRLVQAQAQLAQEQATHEPLRQQIERMMQQDIVARSQMERRDRSLKDYDETVGNLRHDLEAARSLATSHAQRVAQLEGEAKKRAETEAGLRRSLDESAKGMATARAERDQALSRVRELERKLEELGRQAAETRPAPDAAIVPTNVPARAAP